MAQSKPLKTHQLFLVIIHPSVVQLFFLFQNLELARHELRTARQKQMELIQLRERLLGRMADGVT